MSEINCYISQNCENIEDAKNDINRKLLRLSRIKKFIYRHFITSPYGYFSVKYDLSFGMSRTNCLFSDKVDFYSAVT